MDLADIAHDLSLLTRAADGEMDLGDSLMSTRVHPLLS